MTILLVEDDVMIASGLQYALEAEGYTVVCCASVGEAYSALKAHVFSLAILDITLPDGNGYEVFKSIRTNDDFR